MLFPNGTYSSDQLAILQTVFDQCCLDLKLAATDASGRDRVALALMDISRVGEMDIDRLKAYASSRYHAVGG